MTNTTITKEELLNEERALKSKDASHLRSEVARRYRVFDSRGMSKTDLVWLILEAQHGRKTINRLLGY